MTVEDYKVVILSYTLTSGDEVVEVVDANEPMSFIFGSGYLLPKFEENLEGKKAGDKFDFELACEDAYGEIVPDAVVELNKTIFKGPNGEIDSSLFEVGKIIPLRDEEGNVFDGRVIEVLPDALRVDLNHPMAGKNLHFVGEILGVRDATKDELASLDGGCSCGSCGGGCNDSNCHC